MRSNCPKIAQGHLDRIKARIPVIRKQLWKEVHNLVKEIGIDLRANKSTHYRTEFVSGLIDASILLCELEDGLNGTTNIELYYRQLDPDIFARREKPFIGDNEIHINKALINLNAPTPDELNILDKTLFHELTHVFKSTDDWSGKDADIRSMFRDAYTLESWMHNDVATSMRYGIWLQTVRRLDATSP